MSTPSIDEVAAAAGVHKSTVSRAFSRPEAVKRETREHVRQVAASMGYTMSPLAQALRTKVSTLVPLVVPVIIVLGFFFGVFTATEAGAVVAGYSFFAAIFYYRNVSLAVMARLAYDSAILTASVIFLLAVASVFQYLMGVTGVPGLLADVLTPLAAAHWLFLVAIALITMMFGMVLEGLPAAVVLIPVVFPIAEKVGIDPYHFNIVITASVGIGLFLPPMGVGLLMALRFANLTVGQHWRAYMPYVGALMVGLMLIILFPEISLFLPRLAGALR